MRAAFFGEPRIHLCRPVEPKPDVSSSYAPTTDFSLPQNLSVNYVKHWRLTRLSPGAVCRDVCSAPRRNLRSTNFGQNDPENAHKPMRL